MKYDGKKILSEVFNLAVEKIPSSVKIGEISEWDSLGHMRLALHIEKIISRNLTTDELLQLVDI